MSKVVRDRTAGMAATGVPERLPLRGLAVALVDELGGRLAVIIDPFPDLVAPGRVLPDDLGLLGAQLDGVGVALDRGAAAAEPAAGGARRVYHLRHAGLQRLDLDDHALERVSERPQLRGQALAPLGDVGIDVARVEGVDLLRVGLVPGRRLAG